MGRLPPQLEGTLQERTLLEARRAKRAVQAEPQNYNPNLKKRRPKNRSFLFGEARWAKSLVGPGRVGLGQVGAITLFVLTLNNERFAQRESPYS